MQLDINKHFTLNYIINNNRSYSYLDAIELNFDRKINHNQSIYILDHFSAIQISGTDAQTFLQGQLTTDLNQETIAPMSCYLSRKGRIISLFYMSKQNDSYCLFMPTDIADVFINQLMKYIFKSNVKIEKLTAPVVSIPSNLKYDLKINDQLYVNLDNEAIMLLDESLMKHISENKALYSIQGSWAWQKKQLQNNIPSIYPETIAKFLMHEVNLHQTCAIDFKKGCFIGQEIVARMHYKSKIKYKISLKLLDKSNCFNLNETISFNEKHNHLVLDQIHNASETYCLLSHKE